MSKSIRLTQGTTEYNVMVANLVSFEPNGTGSTIRISTGDFINVEESNRSIRSKLKKLNEVSEAED
jgi:hypothetical protein